MQFQVEKTAWCVVIAALCLLTAPIVSAHPGGHAPAKVERTPGPPSTVAFYEVADCPICAQINSWLGELEKRYPGAATIVRKPGVARRQVVESRCVNELTTHSGSTRGLHVVGHQVPCQEVAGRGCESRATEFLAEQLGQARFVSEPDQRGHMPLLVQLESLLGNFRVEMNRQIGDAKQ